MDKALQKLMDEIDRLPAKQQGPLVDAAGQILEAHKRRKQVLELIQEALAQLRLDMKYLLFDLEATRRERDEALSK
jgi:hypothetical protein